MNQKKYDIYPLDKKKNLNLNRDMTSKKNYVSNINVIGSLEHNL